MFFTTKMRDLSHFWTVGLSAPAPALGFQPLANELLDICFALGIEARRAGRAAGVPRSALRSFGFAQDKLGRESPPLRSRERP